MPIDIDIRLKSQFFHHPKLKKLRRNLGDTGVLSLIVLWLSAREHRPDGILTGMDHEDVAVMADWEGDSEEFVNSLIELRWLDRDENGSVVLHEWQEHQPYAMESERRSQQARKAAQTRWRQTEDTEDDNSPAMHLSDCNAAAQGQQSDCITPGTQQQSGSYASSTDTQCDSSASSSPPQAPGNAQASSQQSPKPNQTRPLNKKSECKPRKQFQKPSAGQANTYALEQGYLNFDAQNFIDYYESNGWKVGRNPMMDWKAAVRSWHSRSKEFRRSGGKQMTRTDPGAHKSHDDFMEGAIS